MTRAQNSLISHWCRLATKAQYESSVSLTTWEYNDAWHELQRYIWLLTVAAGWEVP
jgi:DNA-binding ferritin-like protein (Dps family)